MKHMATKISRYFVDKEYIEAEEYDFYCYALESIFIGGINYLTMLLIAVALGKVIECILLIFLIKMLRGNMGGVHMGKWYECYVVSNIIVAVAMWSSSYVTIGVIWIIAVYDVCIVIICCQAPCVHPNNPITTEEVKLHRKKAVIFSIGVVVITLLLKLVGYEKYVTICFYSMIISTILLMIGKMINAKEEKHEAYD